MATFEFLSDMPSRLITLHLRSRLGYEIGTEFTGQDPNAFNRQWAGGAVSTPSPLVAELNYSVSSPSTLRRNPASQPLTPATKSSIGVLSSRCFLWMCPLRGAQYGMPDRGVDGLHVSPSTSLRGQCRHLEMLKKSAQCGLPGRAARKHVEMIHRFLTTAFCRSCPRSGFSGFRCWRLAISTATATKRG